MNQGLTSKIEKARIYSTERSRIQFESFSVNVDGDNSSHQVGYQGGQWNCDCNYFNKQGYCSHTMAMERVLEQMIPRTTDA